MARTSLALLAVVLMASSSWAAESVRVTAPVANLRARPNTDSRIVAKVNKGAVLEVLAREGAWIRVTAPGSGTSAYISAGLCEAVASAPPAPAASAASQPTAPETSRSSTTFTRSGGSSEAEPLQFGLHADWANKGIDFGVGGRASAGIPGVAHVGVLLTLDYFFGARGSVDAAGVSVDVSGHSLQLGLFPTYSFEVQGVQGYAGAGLSYFRSSFTSSATVGGTTIESSASASSTSLGIVAGAKFNKRFFGEVRYQFGDASHLTLSAGILFASPF